MSMPRVTTVSWTPAQIARLTELLDKGASAVRAAGALNRSIMSVQVKARLLGKPFLPRRRGKLPEPQPLR
jgi:GcrA cell cycle regulator